MSDRTRHPTWRFCRRAFTLVEMLVVVAVIAILVALLLPALSRARAMGRSVTCQNNLRQFGIGMLQRADRSGTFCSGAFDWATDGCVTEVGWVADLVESGTPVGNMLCPSNPSQASQTFVDLLLMTPKTTCVDMLGSPPKTAPDGSPIVNPCREIAERPLGSNTEERRYFVETEILEQHFNTNYTASWWLVRSGMRLDDDGNLEEEKVGCGVTPDSRNTTLGPLRQSILDASDVSTSFVPLLGCGQPNGQLLPQDLGANLAGTPTVHAMTPGPVENPSMSYPAAFPVGTPREGTDGWWKVWHDTLQDYRRFAPVHNGECNLLMGDGSVTSYVDEDGDGLFNNGFTATAGNGFAATSEEFPQQEVFSNWSLK